MARGISASDPDRPPDLGEILAWLREEDADVLETLWRRADRMRRRNVGDAVHLRGRIELSNRCERNCRYCGLRRDHRTLARYVMTPDAVLACVDEAARRGYGTVVLQSGEVHDPRPEVLADLIRRIKARHDLAVTLSLGEHPLESYRIWREAGADRYLLRTETGDEDLFRKIHPPRREGLPSRSELLEALRDLGYQIGGGVMVGIPGQSPESLARDIEDFGRFDLDMIGLGAFIPHPGTPLGRVPRPGRPGDVKPTARITLKTLALARLVRPDAHIPATTALITRNPGALRQALTRGANVVMPDLTPPDLRRLYEIYPSSQWGAAGDPHEALPHLLHRMGRPPGRGRGDRIRRGSEE